jgi:hypothetical protein
MSHFSAYIVEHEICQPGFELPMTAVGWLFNGAAQLCSSHRADVFLVLSERFAQ